MTDHDAFSDHDAPLDLDTRSLCPDGACVGVLNARGVCKVCGAVDDGAVAPAALPTPTEEPLPHTLASDGADDGFPDDRALCSDGACIGVLDGRRSCKVCGAVG
ncbi:MAG: hypothetical protein EXR73_05740 [Myxococcales bacterium]|nr:hypothetical protein [Myxococcales bacterium]